MESVPHIITNKYMERKSFQFAALEEWKDYEFDVQIPDFDMLLMKYGHEGWQIASVSYVEMRGKLYRAIWLQREVE